MIGNDIVDLSDPESSREARHSRFDRRVFTPEETQWISMGPSDGRRRWTLWSAKEAAYKAARRRSAKIIFSPARFVVDLDRTSRGSVRHENLRWPVRVQIDGHCLHSVVGDEEAFAGILSGACRLTAVELRDPSEGVRRFAISSISTQLGVAASDLRIEKVGRIPQLILAREAAPVALSLSHHGSYAGFACRDPRIETVDRIFQRVEAGGDALVPGALPHASITVRSQVESGELR